MREYKPTVKISTYKDHLVIALLDKGPKVKSSMLGTIVSNFNKKDVLMSKEVLDFMHKKIRDTKYADPVFEVINKSTMSWPSQDGIIISMHEDINVWDVPYHTISDNDVEMKVKEMIELKHD